MVVSGPPQRGGVEVKSIVLLRTSHSCFCPEAESVSIKAREIVDVCVNAGLNGPSHCTLGCCGKQCSTLPPHGLQPTRPLCPWGFPGKNTGVGCHFLLQGIFPAQGSNPCLLRWQADSLPLSHQGSLHSPLWPNPNWGWGPGYDKAITPLLSEQGPNLSVVF